MTYRLVRQMRVFGFALRRSLEMRLRFLSVRCAEPSKYALYKKWYSPVEVYEEECCHTGHQAPWYAARRSGPGWLKVDRQTSNANTCLPLWLFVNVNRVCIYSVYTRRTVLLRKLTKGICLGLFYDVSLRFPPYTRRNPPHVSVKDTGRTWRLGST